MPALAELEGAWAEAREDPGFRSELDRAAARLRRQALAAVPRGAAQRGGRAPGVPQARGPQPHRRAQGQQRARSGAARPADGQAPDHRRDRRRPARGRGRDRVRAARPRVHRLHGDRGHAPPEAERRADGAARRAGRAGRRRRANAQGGGVGRDPRLGHERLRHPLHHRLVRRTGAIPVARPRPSAGDRRRGQSAGARAGRQAAAAGDRVRRRRLERDRDIHPVRRGRRGRAGRRRGGRRGDRRAVATGRR